MDGWKFVVVAIEGMMSFLSPCVLPILPIYFTVLSASQGDHTEKKKKQILLGNISLFVLGISTVFFLLALGIGALKQFIATNTSIISIIGGFVILLMGLSYMGIVQIGFLQRDQRFHYQVKQMRPWTAYLLGFTFSFGWTPCIGPMLASVALLATTESVLVGSLLIGVYTLGFILPFLCLGIFAQRMLDRLDALRQYRVLLQRLGGLLLVVMGISMSFNGIQAYNQQAKGNSLSVVPSVEKEEVQEEVRGEEEAVGQVGEAEEPVVVAAPDFSLLDQYGVTHTLSEYKGKVVFLNFWATWCPPCRGEMPDIERLYQSFLETDEEVVILGVAAPNLGREGSKESIEAFLAENDYTFSVVFDETGAVVSAYGISAYPTTFIINTEGNVEGYVPGAIDEETMRKIIDLGR